MSMEKLEFGLVFKTGLEEGKLKGLRDHSKRQGCYCKGTFHRREV